ncbi:MAG: TetR/AcrR family transcriptional regulator [Clostridiales bacterium]|nr:TetR/AcrR family transcriptional regulator [Clostridiales bacterium]
MYTGKNPSALRSKDWLRKALLQLLAERKYTQITIKEICAKADLSRQTFYQMFDSKDEVMEYHFMTLFQEFSQNCNDFEHITISDITCQFFQFFYQHRKFVKELIENNMTYILEQQFEIYLRQIALFRSLNDKETHPDYSLAYIAGALTQILIHWFQCGFDLSAEEAGNMTEQMMTGAVFHRNG